MPLYSPIVARDTSTRLSGKSHDGLSMGPTAKRRACFDSHSHAEAGDDDPQKHGSPLSCLVVPLLT